jgi:hypothetical protein
LEYSYLGYSQKFAARASYYRELGLSEADPWRAETLFGASALFLEMAANMANREMAARDSSAKRNTGIMRITGGLWWKLLARKWIAPSSTIRAYRVRRPLIQ